MIGPRRVAERRLSALERARCAPHFDAVLLDAVRVIDGRVPFWLRPDMLGVTLGHRIYFRRGAYDPSRPEGIELLAHELAHVRQYARGMTILKYAWASRRGYRRNPYEVEARAIGAQAVATSSIARPTASATSIPSTPADMIPPA